jgi:hypothetical protein
MDKIHDSAVDCASKIGVDIPKGRKDGKKEGIFVTG